VVVTTIPKKKIVITMDQATTRTFTIGNEDLFPQFNLKNDIQVGQFVVLRTRQAKVCKSIWFYI